MTFAAKKIQICKQDHITEIANDPLFITFFSRILGLSVSKVLLTDVSALGDFVGAGGFSGDSGQELTYGEYAAAWDAWAIAKIQAEFGVTLKRTTLPFIQLFPLLKAAESALVH